MGVRLRYGFDRERGLERRGRILDSRKRFWRGVFSFHDNMKFYYIKIFLALMIIPGFPLGFVWDYGMWIDIFSDPEQMRSFYIVLLILAGFVCMAWLMLFLSFLRFVFPNFVVVRGENEYRIGRCYWHSRGIPGSWGRRKRRWCGAKVSEDDYVLVAQRRLFNPLEPWSSMYRFWLPKEYKMYRDPTRLKVWVGNHIRRQSGRNGGMEYVVDADVGVFYSAVENVVPDELEELRMREMIVSVQKAAQGSIPHIQDALRHGSFDFSHDTKREIEELHGRKQEEWMGDEC